MRRQNTEKIGDIIWQVLRENNLDQHLYEMQLIQSWKTVLGDYTNGYTEKLTIKNGVLFARISSAALRNELFIGKQLLIKNLNNAVGLKVIHDIRFE